MKTIYTQFIIQDTITGEFHKGGFSFNGKKHPSKAKHYDTRGQAEGVIKQLWDRHREDSDTYSVVEVYCEVGEG